MLSSAWFRFGLLMAAVSLFAMANTPAAGNQTLAYGRQLDAQYQLPPDALARYAAMASGAALDESPRPDSMFADRAPWVGPPQRAGVGHNPYTVVLRVSGVARTTGDVDAQWQAGWQVHESPMASREVLLALPRVSRAGMSAGQPLTLTTSSGRVSFRGERHVAPMLGLVQMHNLDINDVQVQVWSGDAPLTLPVPSGSRATLLTLAVAGPLVWFGLGFWRRTVHKPGTRWPRSGARPIAKRTRPEVDASSQVAAAAPSAEERVITTLVELLTVGRTVHTVYDETRRRNPAKAAPGRRVADRSMGN